MSLLELKDVTVSFPFPHGRPPLLALDGLTLSVEQGELVALVGPSGCGKTTALNVLAGQVRPTSGQVRLAGEPVEGMLPSVGYISQADTLLPWRTVEDNVALAMELRGVPKAQRRETARALMAKMGLGGFERSYPRELSGGMKKRAAIARVLAIDPTILMMDEPFALGGLHLPGRHPPPLADGGGQRGPGHGAPGGAQGPAAGNRPGPHGQDGPGRL